MTFLSLLLLLLASACASTPEPSDSLPRNAQPAYPNNSYPSDPSYPSNSDNPVQPSLSSAQPADPDNPYAPLPGDDRLSAGNVYLDSAEVLVMESYPPQFRLSLRGSLPTPCHALRVKIDPPDENNNIYIHAYSVADPGRVCAQVLQSFEAAVPLKNLIPGRYVVWVNGEKIAEIDG